MICRVRTFTDFKYFSTHSNITIYACMSQFTLLITISYNSDINRYFAWTFNSFSNSYVCCLFAKYFQVDYSMKYSFFLITIPYIYNIKYTISISLSEIELKYGLVSKLKFFNSFINYNIWKISIIIWKLNNLLI